MTDAADLDPKTMLRRHAQSSHRLRQAIDAATAMRDADWDESVLDLYARHHYASVPTATLGDISVSANVLWARHTSAQADATINLLRAEREMPVTVELSAVFDTSARHDMTPQQRGASEHTVRLFAADVERMCASLRAEGMPNQTLEDRLKAALAENPKRWLSAVTGFERWLAYMDRRTTGIFNNCIALVNGVAATQESEMAADYLCYQRRCRRVQEAGGRQRLIDGGVKNAQLRLGDLKYSRTFLDTARVMAEEYETLRKACDTVYRPSRRPPEARVLRH